MDAKRVINKNHDSDLPVALRQGEEVLIRGVISGGIYWKTIAIFIFAVIITLLAWQLGILFMIVTAVAAAYAYMMQNALLLIVTNQRIFVRSGIIKVDTVQLRLDRVESVEIQRTIPGQLLGYATIVMTGVGARLAFIPFLANATRIRDIVNELLYVREEKPTHVIVDQVKT